MKAELIGLADQPLVAPLVERLLRRWRELATSEALDIAGGYDGCVENDEQVAVLVRSLARRHILELAFGPMPEPRCTVCHSLNRPENYNNTVICAILDYHDKTMRDAAPKRWKGGDEAYRRCMVIYTAAQEARDVGAS